MLALFLNIVAMFAYDEYEDASTQPMPVFFLCLIFVIVKTYSILSYSR